VYRKFQTPSAIDYLFLFIYSFSDTTHSDLIVVPIILRSWKKVFHCRPNKICSHTTEPTTTMYFKWLF